MAYFRIEYYSNALRRETSFEMLIPNDPREEAPGSEQEKPMKTLFLLHGYTGKAGNYVPQELPGQYSFAIVMPTGENSFYLNGKATGRAYQTMLGEELIDYVRKTFRIALRPEDTCIAGLSMGGFGALHTGLAYPDRFSKIGAMSSALIHHEVAGMKPGKGNDVANYDYYLEVFGEPEKLLESDNNPETLIRKLKAAGKKIPDIYMCCGTEDFLIENNRRMHRFLEEEGVAHEYHEAPGIHDMVFWTEHIRKIVKWMFE